MDGWVKDEMTWSDAYSKKPVEYLEAVAVGETPIWSTVLKKYVYGDTGDISLGGTSKTIEKFDETKEDSELPF